MTEKFKGGGFANSTVSDFNTYVLSKLKSGDEDAFKYIFLRLKTPLFHFITKMIGSGQDAEDICQETFATLWLKREKVDEEKNIKTFIFGIAKRIVWNYMREHRRKEIVWAETGLDTDEGLSPDQIIQLRETELLTEYAISKLPARTRQIYELHLHENLSNEQIAGRLGISTENVRANIYQARKRIREIITLLIMAGVLSIL